MESRDEINLKAPPLADYYSDITKGFYFQHQLTGNWHIYNREQGWVYSAHGQDMPRGLIPLFIPEQNGPQIRGKEAVMTIVDEAFKNDDVNQPSHYKRKSSDVLRAVRSALLEDGDIEDLECIEAMLSHLSTVDQIRGALRANSFKYRWRYEDKDRLKSLRKARWYEDKLEQLEEVVESINE